MDRRECDHHAEQIVAHLTTYAEDNGLKISFKKGVYDPEAGFADITLTVIGEGGKSQMEADLERHASYEFTAFKPEWINKEVNVKGRMGRIVGYKPKSHKYPFIVEFGNGDRHKLTEDYAVRLCSDEQVTA